MSMALTRSIDPALTVDVQHTARYLARAVCAGDNELGEVIAVLRDWEDDEPGLLQAAARPEPTGTPEDLAMALLFEAAAGS